MRRALFRKTLGRSLLIFFLGTMYSCEEGPAGGETWEMNSLENVGGHPVTLLGEPEVFSRSGKAIEFDGEDDGLLVDVNPIHGMQEFTIEVDFKPYRAYPDNVEQRFLHLQDPLNENRRILLELRLNSDNEWYGDWFLKSENESLTLKDSTLTHPVDEWATISLVYREGVVKGFVNGKEEVSGSLEFLPIGAEGKTSVGTRMDKRSWFRGAIREIRFLTTGSDFE